MKKLLILVAVVVVAWLGYSIINPRQKTPQKIDDGGLIATPPTATETSTSVAAPVGKKVTVTYQNNAFAPNEVKLKVGDTVVFQNKHSAAIRVASNPHPIHTSFSALDSSGIDPGESYEFTFKAPVTVHYHNHYNPSVGGTIVVE